MTQADVQLAQARPSAAARVLMVLITGYRRFVGPMFSPRCRFAPSCSAYALEAVREHGAAGSIRCRPPRSVADPVPREQGRDEPSEPPV